MQAANGLISPVSFGDMSPKFNLDTVVVSGLGNENEVAYLVKLATNTGQTSLASADSDNLVKLYRFDENANNWVLLQSCPGHTATIWDMNFSVSDPNMLCTASEDGYVLCWDVRSNEGKPTHTFAGKGKPFWSCAASGHRVVGGGIGPIYFWDTRTDKCVDIVEDFHTEEVLQLRFHPTNSNLLLSGSEDGTINFINLDAPSKDDCIETSFNTEQPVRCLGFFGPNNEYAYSMSSVETLSLWGLEDGQCLSSFLNIREDLTSAFHQAFNAMSDSGLTAMPTSTSTSEAMELSPIDLLARTDYLIDCFYDINAQRLFLCSGNHAGSIQLSHININQVQPLCVLAATNSHHDTVRDICWKGSTLISCSEDAKLCIWSSSSSNSHILLSPTERNKGNRTKTPSPSQQSLLSKQHRDTPY